MSEENQKELRVRLKGNLLESLDVYCKRYGISKCFVVRVALRKYLKEKGCFKDEI